MYEQCPVSEASVGANATRLVAGLTALVAVAYLMFHPVAALLFLLWEFGARGLLGGRGSLLASLAKAAFARAGDRRVNAAPKVFAARLGLGMVTVALVAHLLGSVVAASGVMGVLVACALLESLASYCVGCQVYSLLQRVRG